MSVNALFVNPPNERTLWSFDEVRRRFTKDKANIPPVGGLTVAAMLPKDWNVVFVDENVEPVKEEQIRSADIVLGTGNNSQAAGIERIVKRAHNQNTPVVFGGPAATHYFDYEELKDIDHFVLGEAETGVLADFVSDFENGIAKRAYGKIPIRSRGIARQVDLREYKRLEDFFRNQDVSIIQTSDIRPDLEKTPVPRYDLINLNNYGSGLIQTSRGCPHNCDFCSEGSYQGHRMRGKSVDQVLEELDQYREAGVWLNMFLGDDNLTGNRKSAINLFHGLIGYREKYNYPAGYFSETTMAVADDDEMLSLMQRAGMNMLFMGIETPDEELLKNNNKYQNTLKDMSERIRKVQSYGIEVTSGFILGFDGEGKNAADKIFQFCQDNGIVTAMPGILVPTRGSTLHYEYELAGRLDESYRLGQNTFTTEVGFIPESGRTKEDIAGEYVRLLSMLYDKSGKNYYQRARNLLMYKGKNPYTARQISLKDVAIAGRSVLKQPLSSSGPEYSKFIVSEALKDYRNFPNGIHIGVRGHDGIDMTQKVVEAYNSRYT